FNSTDNNCLYHVTFFNNAAWCCIFDRSNDNITNIRISSSRAAHHTDTKDFFCTSIVSNSQSAFLLNHAGIPPSQISPIFIAVSFLPKQQTYEIILLSQRFPQVSISCLWKEVLFPLLLRYRRCCI